MRPLLRVVDRRSDMVGISGRPLVNGWRNCPAVAAGYGLMSSGANDRLKNDRKPDEFLGHTDGTMSG